MVFVAWVSQALHGGALEFGWMLSAQGIGVVMGALLIGSIGKAVKPLSLMAGGMVLCAVWLGLIVAFPLLWLDLILITLLGLGVIGFFISMQTLVQKSVDDAYRGRVFAALSTTTSLAPLLGMGLGSVLGTRVGVGPSLYVSALMYVLAALVAFLLLHGTEAHAT